MHAIESDSFRPRPRARESDFYSRTRDEYEHEDDDEGAICHAVLWRRSITKAEAKELKRLI
jgi:hypothetical protein